MARALGEAVDSMGVGKKLARYQLQAVWPELVGERLARHTQPTKVLGRSLTVITSSPAWSQEIALGQSLVLTLLNERFPRLGLTSIRCRVGTLRAPEEEAADARTPDLSQITLSGPQEARVEQMVAGIQDPGLRASARRAMLQSERRNQWLRSQGAVACMECGALQDSRTCLGCRQENRRHRRDALFYALGRRPWLTFREAELAVSPLDRRDYHQVRRQLLSVLMRQFYVTRALLKEGAALPPALRQLLLEVCMLATSTPWDQLGSKHVLFSLGKTWGNAYLQDKVPPPYVARPKKEASGKPEGRPPASGEPKKAGPEGWLRARPLREGPRPR